MRDNNFLQYVMIDLMSEIAGISSKAMFGGFGLYKDGVIFAIVADDRLFFKADDSNRAKYEAAGSSPLTYDTSKKKDIALSYWEVPAEIQEDREALTRWVEDSCRISRGHKATTKSRPKTRRG